MTFQIFIQCWKQTKKYLQRTKLINYMVKVVKLWLEERDTEFYRQGTEKFIPWYTVSLWSGIMQNNILCVLSDCPPSIPKQLSQSIMLDCMNALFVQCRKNLN